MKYLTKAYRIEREKMIGKEICNDVFTFNLFTEQFADDLIKIAEDCGKWSKGGDEQHYDERIKNIELYPTRDVHVQSLGLEKQFESLVFDVFAPLVSNTYAPYKTKGLNLNFIVKYSMDGQRELKAHHDSATYTVNVALSTPNVDFNGGGNLIL